MIIGYQELERRSKLILPESNKKIKHALNVATKELQGLRYSEIEMFIALLTRETKKNSYLNENGFENPPLI
jgi:hypothetical protein